MPTSRGKPSSSAGLVEAKSSSPAGRSSTTATPPSSPKVVHFAPSSSDLVSGVSRGLTPAEAWSLYHFEMHARSCPSCFDPLNVYMKGRQLCAHGHALAQDVAIHVCHQGGAIYSTTMDDRRPVRVELQPKYDHTRGLLESIDRAQRSRRRSSVVGSDSTSTSSSARRASTAPYTERAQQASASKIMRPTFYSTVVVQDPLSIRPTQLTSRPKLLGRRDSVLEASDHDRQPRSGQAYRTEICTPEREERKRESRRGGSGFR